MFTLSLRQLRFAFVILALLPLIVLQANADSRFLTPPVYAVGAGPAGVASADFNGDGKLDLVTANRNGFNISVLLNNGAGTFLPAVNYSTGADLTPSSVAVADLNGDGKLDIAVSGEGCCGGQLVVFLGNGDGTFQVAVPYNSGGDNPGSVVIADANGDGKLDLIVPGMGRALPR